MLQSKLNAQRRVLERQGDFNTVAIWSVVDTPKNGFVDFEAIKKFMSKFNSKLNTAMVNAVLRRMNFDEDFKIEYREFTVFITPVTPSYSDHACVSRKQELNLPDKSSDDILRLSKFLDLL